jgi:hypothetical protein
LIPNRAARATGRGEKMHENAPASCPRMQSLFQQRSRTRDIARIVAERRIDGTWILTTGFHTADDRIAETPIFRAQNAIFIFGKATADIGESRGENSFRESSRTLFGACNFI